MPPDTWPQLNLDVTTCRACPRLVDWREQVAREKRRAWQDFDYWGRPVPGFGDVTARLWLVGLAPGAHGSNRTGQMFTGDSSGDTLFAALHRAGFASQPSARSRDDGLTLRDAFITAVAAAPRPKQTTPPNCSMPPLPATRVATHAAGAGTGGPGPNRLHRLSQPVAR